MSEPTWLAADLGAASELSPPSRGERMHQSPQNTHSKEDDGKDQNKEQSAVVLSALLCFVRAEKISLVSFELRSKLV